MIISNVISRKQHKNSQEFFFILFVFAISQVCLIFHEAIPFAEYVALALSLAVSILIRKNISVKAAVYSISVALILILGVFFSNFIYVKNDNYFLCIAFASKVFMFCNIAKGKKTNINQNTLTNFFDVVMVFAAISCTYNLVENITQIFSLSLTMNAYMAIFSSFYSGRNTFAAFLGLYIVICMYQIVITKKKIYYLLCVILLFNLFTTFSRASLLLVGITIIFFVMKQAKDSYWKKVLVLVAGVCMMATFIIILFYCYEYIDHFLIRSDYGDSYRIDYWNLAFKTLRFNPFFGAGAGCAEFILAPMGNNAGTSFHNTYIEILLWGGSLFFAFYVVILIQVCKAIKCIKKYDTVFYNLYSAFLKGFLVYCFFETSMPFALGGRADFTTLMVYVVPVLYAKSFERGYYG